MVPFLVKRVVGARGTGVCSVIEAFWLVNMTDCAVVAKMCAAP